MKNMEQIYMDNYEVVYKYLFANTHDADIAEELAQETFYRAVKNINKFKGNSKISTWLCSIAKNLLLAEFKRKNKFNTLTENDLVVSDETIFDNEETSLYKKVCYLLKVDNYFNFIDKETGLTIKEINIDNNMVIDYSYFFDSVTNEMIQELIEQYKN